jgi:hypothetical protein
LPGKNAVELTTIATFDNMPSAHIAKGRLEAEGIPCWLKDENLGQTDWLYNIAVGWIKLQVEPHHVLRAREILATDYSDDVDMRDD